MCLRMREFPEEMYIKSGAILFQKIHSVVYNKRK